MSLRIKPEEMKKVFLEKLKAHHATDDAIAEECAEIMVENSVNGVYSHGVNRFPRMISYMDKGYIHPEQRPTLVQSFGAFEKWDGNLGMGNTNARICMDRAIELAKKNGIGCVALKNTNHWMRGGQYGLQAADAGCIGICWSNTMPNMPAWGGVDCRIGNNPFILAVPKEGGHLMMDGAMSQFSYGKLEATRLAGKKLPHRPPVVFDQAPSFFHIKAAHRSSIAVISSLKGLHDFRKTKQPDHNRDELNPAHEIHIAVTETRKGINYVKTHHGNDQAENSADPALQCVSV